MIKEKYIDLIKSRVDICDLVTDLSPSTTLHRSGPSHKMCCCIFHNEKTPSLYLDAALNRYHCFGCDRSGDVITMVREKLNLDFDGAIEHLLSAYCPDVDKSDLYEHSSPEENEKRQKARLLYICNKKAHDFFRKEYLADNEEARYCRDYAELRDGNSGRWSQKVCDTISLGFAPSDGTRFISYAKKEGLDFSLLLDLGLIGKDERHPGEYYCKYRNRLMIPQRNNRGIVTFTGRALSPNATSKYINGKDCLIYTKATTIFGIDTALRAAKQSGKVYLTEGAGDVLRLQSIGIANVCAALGKVWTEEHFKVFKRFECTLCFIPDTDVPEEGQRFGVGIRSVIKNAKAATEMGFKVSIREIPLQDGKAADPDDYIINKERWDSLTEQDFILWYAEKLYDKKGTNDDQLKVINELCDLLVRIKDDAMQSSLLSSLKAKFKKGGIWKNAFTSAAGRLQELRRKEASKQNNDLEGFHFYRRGNHYYDLDAQGHERDWSNFILKPLFLILDEKFPTRIFELVNEKGTRRTIELKQPDVTKLDRFREQVEGKGDYHFFENASHYEMLKAYMYAMTEEAVRVPKMGWNNIGERGFYAFCNGIVYDGEWYEVDEYGIIHLENENFYLPASSKMHKHESFYINERRFLHAPKKEVSMAEYFGAVLKAYGNNGIITLCFYMATLFRDIIADTTRSFPLLNVFGKKGTGKTEFILTVLSLLQRNHKISNLDSTTYYAMGDKCDEVCNSLVHFDEYKNGLSSKHIDFLKGAYDNAGRIKRSADGEHRESTSVDCGVILTGQEMPTTDSALFTRLIFLESTKSERTMQETEHFAELKKLRQCYPTNITVELVKLRGNFDAGWSKAWQRAIREIKNEVDVLQVQERIVNNWSIILATIYTLEPFLKNLPFSSKEVKALCIKGISNQQSKTIRTDELSIFWSLFNKARQLGEIKENQDYKISRLRSLSVGSKVRGKKGAKEPPKVITFEEETSVLFIIDDVCFSKVNILAKREGKALVDDTTMLSYLMSSNDCYGKSTSPLKFNMFDDYGNILKKINPATGGQETLYHQVRCLAFNYEAICEDYEIDLRTFTEKVVSVPTEARTCDNIKLPYKDE